MYNWQQRTILLLGEESHHALQRASVLVLGTGGVGSFAAEFLLRAGVGKLILMDGDRIEHTNRNRQIQALAGNTGKLKADELANRMQSIAPDSEILSIPRYYEKEQSIENLRGKFQFAVDAIDSVDSKTAFLQQMVGLGIPVVSSMGAAGKVKPELIRTTDLFKTEGDPLARKMRKRLRELGIHRGILAVYSPEPVNENAFLRSEKGVEAIGTISYMPAAFGAHVAAGMIKIILEGDSQSQKASN